MIEAPSELVLHANYRSCGYRHAITSSSKAGPFFRSATPVSSRQGLRRRHNCAASARCNPAPVPPPARLLMGSTMKLRITIIVSCAGMFAFAQTDLAQAAYPSADVSEGVGRSVEFVGENTALVRDPKAKNKTIVADNKPQAIVKRHLNIRAACAETKSPSSYAIRNNP
jgi:hypothetical protein